MAKKQKVIVVMPAYKAEKTLEKTYRAIPKGSYDEVIVVDDHSPDNTVKIAKKLGLKVIVHEKNKGYGANQKTCYTAALKDGAEIVVMVHPDFQYDPKLVPEITKPIREGKADVVYGSRMLQKGGAQKGGMPRYKQVGNFLLTSFFNFMLNTHLTDAATGYISYNKNVLKSIHFMRNDDGFTFDEEVIIQIAAKRFRIAEIPIPTKYEDDSSSIDFWKSVKYGISLFTKVLRYKLHQYRIWDYYLIK